MKIVVFMLLTFLCFQCFADEPTPVAVYCTSPDTEAGFKDANAIGWCKQFAKEGDKKGSFTIVTDKAKAAVVVEYLGIEEIRTEGEATYFYGGYTWRPDQTKAGARATVSIGDFKKGFFGSGINFQGPGFVIRQIESWIRENREAILEKAKKK